ncbi:MAG: hypothetical protein AAGF95_28920 [Chloroflexota bacterium]
MEYLLNFLIGVGSSLSVIGTQKLLNWYASKKPERVKVRVDKLMMELRDLIQLYETYENSAVARAKSQHAMLAILVSILMWLIFFSLGFLLIFLSSGHPVGLLVGGFLILCAFFMGVIGWARGFLDLDPLSKVAYFDVWARSKLDSLNKMVAQLSSDDIQFRRDELEKINKDLQGLGAVGKALPQIRKV